MLAIFCTKPGVYGAVGEISQVMRTICFISTWSQLEVNPAVSG